MLLSLIGGKTYDLLRNLLSPTDPKEKTFDELIETLSGHFEPGTVSCAVLNRLLTEKNLTLTKAFEVAVSMEAAAKEVIELQATSQLSTGATPVKGDMLNVTAN